MTRIKSKAVPESNRHVPQDTYVLCGITMEQLRRIMSEVIDKSFDKLDKQLNRMSKLTSMLRAIDPCLADFEHKAQQPCLAMEADVKPGIKTRKRTGDAAEDRATHRDKSSFARVDHDPMCLTSFGDDSSEPPALSCKDGALVDKGAEVPKPCLSHVEMRTPPVAGGLLPAGTASTAMRNIFSWPLFSWALGEETKEKIAGQTLTRLASPC